MGGTWGEVRGQTKIETYLRYVDRCEGWPGSHYPTPTGKKWCYKQMQWDDKGEEWVLSFRFHK